MGIFRAYFDASGDKRSPILTVAGFVSRAGAWERFDKEWASILAREKVSSMHMTDFVSSGGEYTSWRGQTHRRRQFVSDLVGCIRKNTNKGFAKSVILSDYNHVNSEFMLREAAGQPFTLCMRACLGALAQWAGRKKTKTANLFVAIEKGDEDQAELVRMAISDGFKVVALEKSEAAAFQAGDMAAWKSRNVLHNALYGAVRTWEDAEKFMKSLDPIRPIVQDNGVYDKDKLLRMCVRAKVPRRG
jgi:hypothetical protein